MGEVKKAHTRHPYSHATVTFSNQLPINEKTPRREVKLEQKFCFFHAHVGHVNKNIVSLYVAVPFLYCFVDFHPRQAISRCSALRRKNKDTLLSSLLVRSI